MTNQFYFLFTLQNLASDRYTVSLEKETIIDIRYHGVNNKTIQQNRSTDHLIRN